LESELIARPSLAASGRQWTPARSAVPGRAAGIAIDAIKSRAARAVGDWRAARLGHGWEETRLRAISDGGRAANLDGKNGGLRGESKERGRITPPPRVYRSHLPGTKLTDPFAVRERAEKTRGSDSMPSISKTPFTG